MATVGEQHVDEETIVYYLFPPTCDGGVAGAATLEEFRAECFKFLCERSRAYIWHEESMNLSLVHPAGTPNQQPQRQNQQRQGNVIIVGLSWFIFGVAWSLFGIVTALGQPFMKSET